jgi:two-component system phosphate regulon sensor histidine kinase PhoR
MNTFLTGALIFSLLALVSLAWRHLALRRKLESYTRLVEQVAISDSKNAGNLPNDLAPIESLTNAIHALGLGYDLRLEEIQTERDRLEATLTQMTDGVLIADAQGRIQMANPAAEKLFGEGEPLIGKTVSLALRHHQLIETWRKCQHGGEMQSETVELPGSHRFLQLIAIPDKHAGGAILLTQDLTRIRRLETVRRDFISNVSHELRTPLASIKALTETLQEGALDDPPAAQRFLGRIVTEVDALTQMAAELLELSRIESGQVPLELKPLSAAKLLNSTSERMKTQTERAGLTLEIDCPPGLPEISADLPRMQQVLVNLIHNAVKFTPPGGTIKLTCALESGGTALRFCVQDTGCGIPSDDLTRIFERFYRVDRSRSGGGTVLGLSIARHLVEAHGGRIWAESREGQGSRLIFIVPSIRNNSSH